jgi:hypothetical protein
MKFALLLWLCAWIPLGIGCTSPDRTRPNSGTPANAGPAEPAGSAASLAGPLGKPSTSSEEPEPRAVPQGPAYLMRMIDYRSGHRLELVNESHTSSVAQYSKRRGDPSRKVVTDEWMVGLIDYLREQGWSKEVRAGNAPTAARDSLHWALEMTGPDGTSYIAQPMDASGSRRTRLRTMQKAFVDTYNATQGWQAVRVDPGTLPFKAPDYGKKQP